MTCERVFSLCLLEINALCHLADPPLRGTLEHVLLSLRRPNFSNPGLYTEMFTTWEWNVFNVTKCHSYLYVCVCFDFCFCFYLSFWLPPSGGKGPIKLLLSVGQQVRISFFLKNGLYDFSKIAREVRGSCWSRTNETKFSEKFSFWEKAQNSSKMFFGFW